MELYIIELWVLNIGKFPNLWRLFRCLLAGDSVLADLVSAIPKHLTRLGLAWGPNSLGGCLRKTVSQGSFPSRKGEISRWELWKFSWQKKASQIVLEGNFKESCWLFIQEGNQISGIRARCGAHWHIWTAFSSHHFGLGIIIICNDSKVEQPSSKQECFKTTWILEPIFHRFFASLSSLLDPMCGF